MFQSFDTPGGGANGKDRLAKLRSDMQAAGVDGCLIPRADAHQGEYVPPRDERLAWLTGFTGSAGFAVALAGKAAVFVDGRYTLQAAAQVDGDAFEINSLIDEPPSVWLSANAPQGGKIAYDPWLHPQAEVERFTKALMQPSGELVAWGENLIDQIWDDQPAAPRAAIHTHDDAFAGESHIAKRGRLGNGLKDADIDATVLTLPDSIAWLLNIRGGDIPRNPVPLVFAILRANGAATLFAEEEQVDQALKDHLGRDVSILPKAALLDVLAQTGDQRIALDPASCPMAVAHAVEAAGGQIVWRQDPCIMPKACKNEVEIQGARNAHRRDAPAMVRLLRWLDDEAPKGELTEIDIARRLESERRATNQLLDISFDTISGSGPNAALPHYRVSKDSNRTLNAGELMLVDSGGQYRDGTTDITRTMSTGTPAPDAVRAFTLVLKGMINLSMIRFPKGTAGRDIDVLARAALWKAGLDYAHGTGHGVGSYLCVHEGPARIAKVGVTPLAPGMILSNEPGYYLEGAFGIRIENLITVTEPEIVEGGTLPMMGFETLTLVPIDVRLIDKALMTAEEIDWLNAYHARVLDEISPDVEGEDRAWLEVACRAI